MTTMPTGPGHDPRRRRYVLLVFAALAILYLLTLNNQWAIEPDSAVYLTLGRSLAEGRGLEYNGAPAGGVPPLLPVLIAGSRLLFGPAYWPINLLISLSALGTVIFAYLTVRRLAPEVGADDVRLALAALLITGTSARMLIDSTRILTDVPCTFFVALGLYALVRARQGHWAWCWAGLGAMLLATALRLPAGVILVGLFVGLALEFRREGYRGRLLATLAGMVGVAAGSLGWWFLVRGRSIGGPDYFVTIFERFQFCFRERWIQLAEGPLRLPGALCEVITGQELQGFNVVPTALIFFGLWRAARRGQWVWVCPVLAYVAFLLGLGGSAVAPRYLLPVMPMLVYALAVGTVELAARVSRRSAVAVRTARSRRRRTPERTARRRRVALAVVTAFCVAVSLPKAVREVFRMHQPDFYETYEGGEWKGTVDLGRYLGSLRESGLAGPTDRVLRRPRRSCTTSRVCGPTRRYGIRRWIVFSATVRRGRRPTSRDCPQRDRGDSSSCRPTRGRGAMPRSARSKRRAPSACRPNGSGASCSTRGWQRVRRRRAFCACGHTRPLPSSPFGLRRDKSAGGSRAALFEPPP